MPARPTWRKAAIGFGRAKREGDDAEAINRLFTPEFRNRLDAIIAFGICCRAVVHQVVQKFVLQLEAQLADRGVTFDLSRGGGRRGWPSKGYDERMGARPLGRVIQEHIKKPLADEVLFGKLKKGGTVRVTVEKKETGETGLKLESLPDEVPVRPKKEEPKKDPSPRRPRKAAPKKPALQKGEAVGRAARRGEAQPGAAAAAQILTLQRGTSDKGARPRASRLFSRRQS